MNRLLKKHYAFYRIVYVLISVLLLIPIINYEAQLNDKVIIVYGPPLNIVRILLVAGSLIMFFWPFFFSYDSLSFLGIRQIFDFGKLKKNNPSEEIKRNGLLGIIRHPMYFALIIFLWCQTLRVSDLIGNIVLTIYIIVGTKLEERKLVLELGNAYIQYQQEVPMLIPFSKIKKKQYAPLKQGK
jgi:protein-S-isoprenylcysteine O-methyltransferase Ste14